MSKTNSSKMSKKTLSNTVSAVSEWIASNVPDGDLKKSFESKQSELQKVLVHNMKEKQKKEKDPNAPKKAKSGYILFCNDYREKIKEKNPGISAKHVIQELGKLWQNASDDKKKQYNDLADKDKKRYAVEYNTYKPVEHTETGPKRALSAYIFFCKDKRAYLKNKYPDMSAKELTSELGKSWNSLSDSDKAPYVKLSEQDKNRYATEKNTKTEVKPVAKPELRPVEEEEEEVVEEEEEEDSRKVKKEKKEKREKKEKKEKRR